MTESKKFPIPSAEQEDIEEALGVIWHHAENGVKSRATVAPVLAEAVGPHIGETLALLGYVRESSGALLLTESGESLAKNIPRRQHSPGGLAEP